MRRNIQCNKKMLTAVPVMGWDGMVWMWSTRDTSLGQAEQNATVIILLKETRGRGDHQEEEEKEDGSALVS